MEEFEQFLTDRCGHKAVRFPTGSNYYVAISPFIFTHAIVIGLSGDYSGYINNRWCYESFADALKALNEWESKGFKGEPTGWHRHPGSGRRRPDGNPNKEYVNF